MKKCSKSAHHALAELNITPLLDLAFVLLVIFIITTTPVVNDLDVDLPSAAKRPKDPKPKVNYVTVESTGRMFLNRDPVDLASLQEKVVALRMDEPDLNIVIRGSARTKYQHIVGIMDMLQQANVGKVNLATESFPDGAAAKE
ncbi:MAG TPA: biopolymer transporter ExbD [Candidatus Binatia bacterium]|jgi:biopolymer transport protein ExbD|nr:biopolymer transporter ExbD [Candidatus Binatia bacterium]